MAAARSSCEEYLAAARRCAHVKMRSGNRLRNALIKRGKSRGGGVAKCKSSAKGVHMGWTGPMRGIAPVAPKPLGAAAAVGLADADAESRKYHRAVHDKAMAAKSRRKDRRWRKPKSGKAKGRVQSSLANATCVIRMSLWSCLFHTGLCASVIGPPVPVPGAAAFSSAVPSTASTLVSCSPLIVLVLVLLAIACGASWPAGRCGKGASYATVCLAATCLPGAAAAPAGHSSSSALSWLEVVLLKSSAVVAVGIFAAVFFVRWRRFTAAERRSWMKTAVVERVSEKNPPFFLPPPNEPKATRLGIGLHYPP